MITPHFQETAGDIEVLSDANAVARRAAEIFFASAARAVERQGRFSVALSGGKTPKVLYELLATEPQYRESLPWNAIYFFFGDERHVPPDHADSNFRMANEALFKRAPIPEENIFRVQSELTDANEAARRYQQAMGECFPSGSGREDGFPVFDLVFLGMGPDGHTASLFPGSGALVESENWVVANWVAKFATQRITMTFPVLNHAREVVVLVTGGDKAPVMKEIFGEPAGIPRYPIQQVVPRKGSKLWLADRAAYPDGEAG